MDGENIVEGNWVGERIEVLKKRVAKRVTRKSEMSYQNIDSLLIGVRDWFVRRINSEYHEQKDNVIKHIESWMPNSIFKQFVLVSCQPSRVG